MKHHHRCEGGTLVVAMLAVLVITAAVGVAYKTTGATGRMTDRSREFMEAKLATEGALEYAFGVWKSRVQTQDRAITTAEATSNLTGPTFTGFTYMSSGSQGPLNIQATDTYGTPMTSTAATPAPVIVSLPDYPGWRGRSFNYVASARIQQTNVIGGALSTGAKRRFQYVEVPLFQAMFFYEHDLELYRPAAMIVSGLVHTNSDTYLSTGNAGTLTFQGNVSYVGTSYSANGGSAGTAGNTAPPGGAAWSGGTMYPATYPSGEAAQVHQVSRYEPLGKDAASILNTADTNPNNDSFREIIEPPVTGSGITDPPEIAKRRMYNKAGIIVTINGTTATVTTQNGTTLTSAQTTAIQSSFTGKTTFYDQREGTNVDVANISVSTLTPVLNAASGFNGIFYIQDVTPQTSGNMEPKTIRLKDGGILPNNGLSIVSQNPVYVQGDYNTGTTTVPTAVPANSTGNPNNTDSPVVSGYTRKSAAIMADAVMLLSNSWSDANASSSVGSRVASNTTYNMAILAGVMPSLYTPPVGDPHYGAAQYGYSGGANNYPRFLESWSGKSCTYFGSMTELFQSKVFTGKWDTGNIYVPPSRRWNFDTNFTNTPPPGSLDAVTLSRGMWSKM
ncbi:MAG: hypothetical protein K8R23_11105 [Chthoniobacter sp.]|nr:hypothetical protein [Chthoniobacter sp.]